VFSGSELPESDSPRAVHALVSPLSHARVLHDVSIRVAILSPKNHTRAILPDIVIPFLLPGRFDSHSHLHLASPLPPIEAPEFPSSDSGAVQYTCIRRFSSMAVPTRLLNCFGGSGQDNVVGISRTQFLADVGLKAESVRCV
jgi:hypothetical protein